MFNDLIEVCSSCGCDLSQDGEDRTETCKKCSQVKEISEGFVFDKFIDSILLKENKQKKATDVETPSRLLAKRARRLPADTIKFGKIK
jgi:hypothetical protein